MRGKNILLVGCGRMGQAFATAWLQQKNSPYSLTVVEPSPLPFSVEKHYQTTVEIPATYQPDCIFFAIKPQLFSEIVPQYQHFLHKKPLIISIAAGVSCAQIEQFLSAPDSPQNPFPIVRTMPNLAVTIGEGITTAFAKNLLSVEQQQDINSLFAVTGCLEWLEAEQDFDAVTAISGSGPAYIFYFMECLEQAAQDLGLEKTLAQKLALETIIGSIHLAQQSKVAPALLREQVTSPNGTTAAALKALMHPQNGLAPLLKATTQAAQQRSVELGKGIVSV